MPDKPTIYRITHLWPNKQPGHGSTTAQIEQGEETIKVAAERYVGSLRSLNQAFLSGDDEEQALYEREAKKAEAKLDEAIVANRDSSTVQIKPETDELNALPSRFVSLQDYERLERVGHRVLILDDAEPGEVSEAHVAVIGELRAALSSEATKGDAE